MTGTQYTTEDMLRIDPIPKADRSSSIMGISNLMKRLFDILVSFIGLILLSPFFWLIGSFIRRDSPGPVFFRCDRMGKDQRTFKMLKFRTMYDGPESYAGPSITCEGDERITPFGRWLRDTKINELPQLWNVLKGEMSLVGPRPEDVDIAREWSEEDRKLIYSVLPGITSPASILYRDEEQLLSKGNLMQDYLEHILPDKMRFDRLYVQNRGFTSDLDILFWTLVIIIPNIIKTKIPEGYIFAGPISRVMNRFVTWFLADLLISFIVLGGVSFFWRLQAPLDWGAGNLSFLAFVIAAVFTGFNYVLGLNKIIWQGADLLDAIRLSLSCWVVFVILILLNSLHSMFNLIALPALPVSLIIITGLFSQIGFLTVRYHWRILATLAGGWLAIRRNRMEIGERVLIVGARDGFVTANWLLRRSELSEFQNVFHVVGVVDDKILGKQGMILNGCSVLGQLSDIPSIVEKQRISVIVFTTMNVPKNIKEYIADLKQKSYVKIVFLDNVSKMINQELTVPLHPPVHSLWSGGYHEYLAIHDSFTGLPNRTLFQDRLIHAMALSKRYNTKPAVAFVEISLRKSKEAISKNRWNDIMKQIIDRLLKFKRASDSIGFMGGGVFAFLLENVPDDKVMSLIVNRLAASLSDPIQVENQVYHAKIIISVNQEIEECLNKKENGYHMEVLDCVFANRIEKKVFHE